jgi:hypothetical protein
MWERHPLQSGLPCRTVNARLVLLTGHAADENRRNRQEKKHNTENDGDPEEGLFDTASGCKMPPVSAPVRPPNPAPLLCKMTLMIRAIDVIIRAIFKK